MVGHPNGLEFTDRSIISDWAQNAVLTANNENLIDGYPDGTFKR